MIWEGSANEVERWLDNVFSGVASPTANLVISERDIEG